MCREFGEIIMEESLDDVCHSLREQILDLGDRVLCLKKHSALGDDGRKNDKGEMTANIMLAYRHLEDARLRIGKVVQAYDGGTSCYGSG
jgi:hypothetical protein